MALLFLIIAFCFSLYGGWIFFDGYFTSATPNEQWLASITGIAFAVIPYMIAKCLTDMVAIRQRHLSMEQQMQQNYVLNQQLQAQTRSLRPRPAPPAPQPAPPPPEPVSVSDDD